MDSDKISEPCYKTKKKINLRNLKISLKFRPKIFKLILKLYSSIKKKSNIIVKLKKRLIKEKEKTSINNVSNEKKNIQVKPEEDEKIDNNIKNTTWNLNAGGNEKSIAEQVKEAAQSAMDQSGMVYVESAGMYYDYKTGYYYNADLGLYYHSDTKCYYYYSEEKNTFVFHSYPDSSKISREQKAHEQYKKKQAKKNKKDNEEEEAIENEEPKSKLMKKKRKRDNNKTEDNKIDMKFVNNKTVNDTKDLEKQNVVEEKLEIKAESNSDVIMHEEQTEDLEDGECSDTDKSLSEHSDGNDTTTTASDEEDWVSSHHPPCMRMIVKETKLPKLKVGTLFLVTKDGGTIGREGDHHIFILRDVNVSREHMDIKYDMERKCYAATDLGSKNGSVLNGHRMSESQQISAVMAIPHGSVLQLGETKLLCHIHPGTNTCGHCEPGLIMEEESKKQIAYTRTCSVQQQYQLELCRLKNKYGPEPLAIEEGSYNDRAKQRREEVGSSHHSEKTVQADLETTINQENKGFQLLKKMGWSKGEGLGKDSQGDTEPIPLVNNETKAGLGAPGSRAAVTVPLAGQGEIRFVKKMNKLKPPAKAFRDPLEDSD